jgi:hypothetical protein
MALRERFFSMEGKAILTADTRKVPMKEVADTTTSVESSLLFCCRLNRFINIQIISLSAAPISERASGSNEEKDFFA